MISSILIYVLFILGLILIAKGADWFVDSAVSISKRSGIPKAVIGATVVSFATTAPEFTVSFMAAVTGHADMAIGNAVGSTICNIGIAIGFIAVLKAIRVDDKAFNVKVLLLLISGAVLFLLCLDGMITAFDGLILLAIFAAYMIYTYVAQKKNPDTVSCELPDDKTGVWAKVPLSGYKLDAVVFIVGAALVILGSKLVVDNGITIAQQLGIPELIISLTVISIGTSLPEIVTAITSFRKGCQELSVGNIVGANVLDITMILGVSSLFAKLPVNSQLMNYDFIFMMVLFVLLAIFGYKKRITRWQGGLIAVIYVIYVVGLFVWV
ncbi:Inner membrane protein YrbG [Methanosarcinaceae archaeon Ag5]|uniref:Inner membrane protein YrbG n=1 Tax=Methanolapillus africanus TaxID=3028297 RepID=A0AAE4MHW2_9EURY|nr:Inner membrane protein YrbG [Methanosarcinaceae archaeon Ag5]